MKGGYTEAELLAAEWSKQRKRQDEIGRDRREVDKSGGSRNIESKRNNHLGDHDDARDRREMLRSGNSRDRFSSTKHVGGRSDNRYESTRPDNSRFDRGDEGYTYHRKHSRSDDIIGGKRMEHTDIDEFGREVLPGRSTVRRSRDSHSRSRSRERPRDRSRDRSRDRQRGGSRDRSRSHSRSNHRSKLNTWKHDKFDRDQR